MNYYTLYMNIVNNRIKNSVEKSNYFELHHIVPKSLGGPNTEDNIVALSAREHFICHYLLTKIYAVGTPKWYKMQHAFLIMAAGKNGKRYVNSRLYEACRKNFSSVMSRSQSGSKNSQFGKLWITNISLEKNLKIKPEELVHWLGIGWTEGRIINFRKDKKIEKPKSNKKEWKKEQSSILAYQYFALYKESGCKSIGEFVRSGHYPYSKVSLTLLWKKYVPEYKQTVQPGKSFK